MTHQRLGLVLMASGGVRRDMAVRRAPEGMVVGQRLRVRDVEPGGAKAAGSQGLEERLLINRRAASDVVEYCAGLHELQPFRGNETLRLRVVGQNVYHVVGRREGLRQLVRPRDRNSLVPPRVAP